MIDIKNIQITPQMLSAIALLDEFKGSWEKFSTVGLQQLNHLKKISTIESIGSSNRIEGNKLSDKEIESLLNNISKKSFRTRDEQEVLGYADLMNTIFDDFTLIPLTQNYIKQLHGILLQYVSKDEAHRGEYKKISNSVAAFDENGQEIGIVFHTASPFDTPRYMTELVAWTDTHLKDNFYHPLIVIGIFIVHFLAIHPFQDGNGRLSRALTTLLLLQKGYNYVPYSSIESIIESNKDGYYKALRKTQKNIFTDAIDYTPWLSFFLKTLVKQKNHLENKLTTLTTDTSKLTRLAQDILTIFTTQNNLTITEISTHLNAKPDTIRKSVKNLVNTNHLTKNGTTKGAWYSKK